MPKIADPVFRPKADANELAHQLRAAWRRRWDRVHGARSAEAGEVLAAHLEHIYPAADMAVLARYGLAPPAERCAVHVYRVGARWRGPIAVQLARPVPVPHGSASLHTAAPWYADPDAGLTATGRLGLSGEEYAAYARDCAERLTRAVPSVLDAWLHELVEIAEKSRDDDSRAYRFASYFKAEHGRYPRWSEVRAAFPVLGE